MTGVLLFACGAVTSSPQTSPEPTSAGDSTTTITPTGGVTSGGSCGHCSGGGTIVVTTGGMATAGMASNTPIDPATAGTGGQPTYPASTLCMYPEDIPANWLAASAGGAGAGGGGAGGAPDAPNLDDRGCVVPVPGEFNYMGCRYELLGTWSYNVDPFVGGHSNCCYGAQLLACR